MEKGITYVGMDVHKDSIQVAMLLPNHSEATSWELPNDERAARRLARRFDRKTVGQVSTCYEAGVTGYVLQRQLQAAGIACQIVAPSLIPVKPGDRIKTDRRDAQKLASLLRAGVLTEVHPPSEEDESVRDLCRAREGAKEDQTRCRHRLQKFLVRHGLVYRAGGNWTKGYFEWLRRQRFDRTAGQATFDHYLLAVEQASERVRNLEAKLAEFAQQEPYAKAVAALRCFRGIDTVTAMTIVTELHGFMRFKSPRELMAYLGLVPSEHSSGGRRRQGSITKAGNGHVRRLLIESAWHYRHRAYTNPDLRRRREGQPGWTIAIAEKAQQRLHRRFWRLQNNGKPPSQAVVAVARELAGFVWAVLYPVAMDNVSLQ